MGYSCFNVYYTLLYIHNLLYLPLVSNLMSLDAFKDVRPKKGNREKHQEKRRKRPKKQRKHCVKHGKRKKEWGNMWGIAAYRDFLDIQSPVFKPFHTEQPANVGESPVFFLHIFPCEAASTGVGFYTKLGSVQYLYEVRHAYTEQEIRGREFRLGIAFFLYFLFNVNFQYLQHYRLRNLVLQYKPNLYTNKNRRLFRVGHSEQNMRLYRTIRSEVQLSGPRICIKLYSGWNSAIRNLS